MKYFIYWQKPEVMKYYKHFEDGDEVGFLMVPYFSVFENSIPENIFDDVPVYSTSN